jgi:signal transduction histidine kinase
VHDASVRYAGGSVPRLAMAREEHLYRIAQEALRNALRHAEPTEVTVTLAARNGSVVLEVVDDGCGFDPATAGGAARRLGLASMHERARATGGKLTVHSRPGGGTTITVRVPARV